MVGVLSRRWSRWWGRDFGFSNSFTLEAPLSRVHDVLLDLERYSEWWPQVRAVGKLDDDHALVVCRSRLPYDLDLVLTAVSRDPRELQVGIDGPISGWARFRLDEGPRRSSGTSRRSSGVETTDVRFDQEVRADAPSFVVASYLAKPLLRWNHDQMMRGLVAGLRERVQPREASAAS
jgi:Polyketide cyclase / dehydrase and lipid transport